MRRTGFLTRSEAPRRTIRLKPVSTKVRREKKAHDAVYDAVDARSGMRCEIVNVPRHVVVTYNDTADVWYRCGQPAVEHHHLFKPRRSHHTPDAIVHICRACHRLVDAPYRDGRLVYKGSIVTGAARTFHFAIVRAASKFAARGSA